MNERKELLNVLRAIWRRGDSPLRRIYPSWEELEANVDIIVAGKTIKETRLIRSCPNCGVKQEITKPLENIFPYEKCQSCKLPFHVNKDLTVRALTEEEKEYMPTAWIRILDDLNKKKLAIVFKLE